MKIHVILGLGLFIGLFSCDKDTAEITDYRDIVTGDFNGIRVNTYWIDTVVGMGYDTSSIILTLTKSELDSIIELSFNPEYSTENFFFEFKDEEFTSTTNYHPPTLKLTNDSLYFWHMPGLGPYWTRCFTKKIQ